MTPNDPLGPARIDPRYAAEVEATVQTDGGSTPLPTRTRNLSRGGMCFVSPESFPMGKEMTARLVLVFDEETKSEPVEVRARVVWSTGLGRAFQIGVSFISITAEDRAHLDMFLRYLAKSAAEVGYRP